jgi:hypothetical protein
MMTLSLGRSTSAGNRASSVPQERVVGEVAAAADEDAFAGEVHCDFLTWRG